MVAQPEIVDLMNKARATLAGAGAGLSEEVNQTSPPRSSFCDVLVKLGGAAVTNKSELETLDEDTLSSVIRQIAKVHRSRRLVVVHGAGSFGHFQAKEFGVQGGSLEDPRVVRGFAETRASVTKLNTKIVDALVREKVNAVGLSPCAFWDSRGCSAASVEIIRGLVGRGFVPVLHGDAIACGDRSVILSGDKIVADLAEVLRPKVVLFLSNVNGIYNKPPPRARGQYSFPGSRSFGTVGLSERFQNGLSLRAPRTTPRGGCGERWRRLMRSPWEALTSWWRGQAPRRHSSRSGAKAIWKTGL